MELNMSNNILFEDKLIYIYGFPGNNYFFKNFLDYADFDNYF